MLCNSITWLLLLVQSFQANKSLKPKSWCGYPQWLLSKQDCRRCLPGSFNTTAPEIASTDAALHLNLEGCQKLAGISGRLMSFSKAQDLVRLAQMAAARRGGISLEEICAEFDVSHRTAQRMTDALEATFGTVVTVDGEDRKRR